MIHCPACGNHKASSYRNFVLFSQVLKQDFSLKKCGGCGIVFTHPQPTAEQLDRIYGDDSYYAYQPLYNPPPPGLSRALGRFKQWAKGTVIDHYYGYGQSLQLEADSRLIRVGRLLKNLPREDMIAMRRMISYRGGGRHLDVGSGSGAYVRWMQQHGWQSEGIELNARAVENARAAGLNVRKTPLLGSDYPDRHFDLVTAWGVMEHLPGIGDCLREISRILKPGGRFIGFVPNIASWDAALFGERWQGLEIPSHLYHFTPASLGSFLGQAGLKMVGIEFLPGLDSWKATLDGMGIRSGAKRSLLVALGRLMYLISNRVGRGAMFRFDSVKNQ